MSDNMDIEKTKEYFIRCIADPDLGKDDIWENFERRLKFLDKLSSHKNDKAEWESMWDLATFCSNHGDILSLEDLETEVNWGMAGRNGKLCPVVIDAGIS